jgi:hypothetical protein
MPPASDPTTTRASDRAGYYPRLAVPARGSSETAHKLPPNVTDSTRAKATLSAMEAIESVQMAQYPGEEQLFPRTDGDASPFGAFIALLWAAVISLPFWIIVAIWVWP